MKTRLRISARNLLSGISAAALGFLPSLAAAHPGHYHPPGEDDEFDQLRSDWFHLHGYTELILAVFVLGSALLFHFNKNRPVRIGALIVFGGSLTLLAVR